MAPELPRLPRRALEGWYREHGRHALPWRRTRDAYAVLVSEVMLQQTQVNRVVPYFEAWMARWPTARDLAAASPAEAIVAWAGLGYNRRALHLHAAATAAKAGFPNTLAALGHLPGVGPYTARAVASFALGQRAAPVETNIGRVLGRALLGVADFREMAAARVQAAADAALPRATGEVRDHNLALMDVGAAVCSVRTPACEACPLRAGCAWRRAGAPVATRLRRPVERFQDTARYARGRIVDALRGAPALSEGELRELLPPAHRRRLGHYLAALETEGLIAATEQGWSLPGSRDKQTAALRRPIDCC